MRKTLLLSALFGLIFLGGCSKTAVVEDTPLTLQTYTSASGFTAQYPSGWDYQENIYGSRVLFFSPQEAGDPLRENIGIVIQALPAEMTTDDYYKLVIKPQMEKIISNYHEISTEDVTVSGIPAKKLIYAGNQSNYALKRQQVVFTSGSTVYILTYTAAEDTFDLYKKAADALMDSFKIQ